MIPENGYTVRIWTMLDRMEEWSPRSVYRDTQSGALILTFDSGVTRTYNFRNIVSYTMEAR